jgi:hypothetical protein
MGLAYDTSFKELVTQHFASLLPWLLPGVAAGQVVRLPEELPATLRRVDLIIRSEPADGTATIYLIECQCQADGDLPLDLLLRAALAHRQYRLPVETVLLAFTPQAAVAEGYTFGGRGERQCRHYVTVRRIYAEPAEAALGLGICGLLPLVAAMQPDDGDRAGLLRQVLERIVDGVRPDAQRVLMLDQAATFATLSLSRLRVQGIVREVFARRRYMLDPIRDFPWLRHGYEQGIAQGIEKGMAKGIAKGIEKGMAESVLAVLAARQVAVDSALRQQILSCQDRARLKLWLTHAATASTAAEVVEGS